MLEKIKYIYIFFLSIIKIFKRTYRALFIIIFYFLYKASKLYRHYNEIQKETDRLKLKINILK